MIFFKPPTHLSEIQNIDLVSNGLYKKYNKKKEVKLLTDVKC